MSDRQPKRKRDNSEDIADLFRVLRVMASDEDVPEPYFRIAFRIAQYVNADTGWAIVSDRTLEDVLPRTSEKKLRLFRRFMERDIKGKKWLRIVEGERGRPTSYLFIEDRVPDIEQRLAIAAEKREAEFALRKIQVRTALHVAALGGQMHPVNSDGEIGLPGQFDRPSMGGESVPFTGSDLPPLLPQSSTSTGGCRERSETQDTYAPAPMPTRSVPPPPEDDEWLANPIRSESAPSNFRPSNSIRCNCGVPADCELLLIAGGRFEPHCAECADDLFPIAVRPIEINDEPQFGGSYAELSRGR